MKNNTYWTDLAFHFTKYGLVLSILLLVSIVDTTSAGPLDETRYCGPPVRDASGTIIRSSAVRTAFKRAHPCPSTALTSGPCPGWQMDHVIPLVSCGCDSVSNMQWLPDTLKWKITSPLVVPKDRWERWVYLCPEN